MNKAESTRLNLLQKAFEMIYQNGYQATSIDKIIETTQVTKGAFYYHFKNKEEMGLAVINEIIFPNIQKALILPLENAENPLEVIHQTIENFMLNVSENQLLNGCPTNNLIQEMSAINEKFRFALSKILEKWENQLVQNLKQAQAQKLIQEDQDLRQVAKFIIASYEGTRGIGKIYRSKAYYKSFLENLNKYLESL